MRRRVLLIVFILFSTGCVTIKRTPDLDAIFAQTRLQKGKSPVIIIPGVLGSELVNRETGERVWLNLSTSKDDSLALPIGPSLAENRDKLEPRSILRTVKVSMFLPEISVYRDLVTSMENYGGYTEGNWDNPGEDGGRDKYYIFAYDWRRDNVENARILVRRIEELKQKIRIPGLRFNVIAHSMGGLIARYAAMYGDADLPPAGRPAIPNWAGARHFNKIFMFGTPNEGSMGALEGFRRGYRVKGFTLPSVTPEAIFTSPAAFQLLPHGDTARFFDDDLKPLKLDIYDPETWKRLRWSVYGDTAFRAKFAGQTMAVDSKGRKSEFADTTLEDLDRYFAAVLRRARGFHQALDADTAAPPSLSFFAFGSDCDQTLDGAVIVGNAKTGEMQTLFDAKSFTSIAGRKVSGDEVRRLIYSPGDDRVTRRSLLADTLAIHNYRNPIFRRALPVSATFFCEAHEKLPNNKVVQNNFLTALMQELIQ